jgi:hypothetical protein
LFVYVLRFVSVITGHDEIAGPLTIIEAILLMILIANM